jgi:hypothetical protein
MRLFAILTACLALGCAQVPITYQPDPDHPAVVSFDPSIVGRGCIYLSVEDGDLEIIVAQDGTSDWSVARLVAWIGDVAGSVFGGGDRSGSGIGAPDPLQGCIQLFEAD